MVIIIMMKINNKGLVKNYLDESLIKKMYKNCFGQISDSINIKELYGGLKNTVYLIEDNYSKVVLKVAPKNNSEILTVDKNNMWWEAKMLEKMSELDVPAPKLIKFDDSGEICSEEYIFMSYIPGVTYSEIKKSLSLEIKQKIEYKIGEISSKISSLQANEYFLPSQPNKKYNDNYEFVCNLFFNLFNDLKMNNLIFNEEEMIVRVKKILKSNRKSLNNIKKIVLCCSDIWDGNILITNNDISGIVDFGDVYFCDELMAFYFHTIDGKTNKCFLDGYNKKYISYDEEIRIEIYRLYVILKMIVDCVIKKYQGFDWMFDIYKRIVERLEEFASQKISYNK